MPPVLPPRRSAIVGGVMLGMFLAAMESTAVSTAMPTVIASLGGLRVYSWVFSAYLLTSTVAMPLWGKCSDLYGRRPVYLWGLGIFLAGSALSGLAQSMPQLILFRALQGLGAGALLPLGLTIVGDLFGLEQRARMQGYFSATWAVASVVGPLIGGVLTDHLSWRWVFYANLPPGLLAGGVLAWALRPPARRQERVSLDLRGAGAFAAGMTLLLAALVEAGRSGAGPGPGHLAMLAGAGGLLVLFVEWERRADEPFLPLRLFATRIFRAAAASGFLAGMAMFGALSFIPLFVQGVLGGSATEAGRVLTPFVLGWVALSVTSARLLLRVGYRRLVLTGMGCLALAFYLFTRMGVETTLLELLRNMLLGGMGMGLVMLPLLIAVQSAVPRRDLGAATSATTFFRATGGAVGVALMGAVLARGLHAELAALGGAAAGPSAGALLELVRHPDAFIHPATRLALPPALLEAFSLGLAAALRSVFWVGLGVALVALASAFLVPSGRAQELALEEERASPSR
ncbi:MAG: DHA2 family efflux MFS transporter permease subunit [Candidatus Rokubacteria bacterium]|nr:DHA2 family efflux MFS transporter permease subunit [Candidatus Rokubacteria bacterium]MBI2879106.1 DHA2 family efflux MFS transporter permease subunit [Candidatus Rokubacteria bacterium]